jgi:hypothetical protein
MVPHNSWKCNPLRFVSPAPLDIAELKKTVEKYKFPLQRAAHNVVLSKFLALKLYYVLCVEAGQPSMNAETWWAKFLKNLAAKAIAQCKVCNDIRSDLAAVTSHRTDPEEEAKKKASKRRKLTQQYETHR